MVEFPILVMKTRGLLTLRGYLVEELLEYENRYVMHPTREAEDITVKSTVWIFKEPKVIGVAVVRELVKAMEEAQSQEGMLVGGSRVTPASKKLSREMRVELVEGGYSSFDLFGHNLVPKHVVADEEEVQLVLNHYGIARSQLPRIYRDDAAVKVLGAKTGQVIRIQRDSDTAGLSYYYRLIVDPGR
ncbi:MAG: DNA-directed RNA polymerase subunit H [Candidatus Thorarchaeota archaeon]